MGGTYAESPLSHAMRICIRKTRGLFFLLRFCEMLEALEVVFSKDMISCHVGNINGR